VAPLATDLRFSSSSLLELIIILTGYLAYIAPQSAETNSEAQITAQQCTSAKRMTSILSHVAETFPPTRQGTILNSHRVICIAINTAMVLNCALVTYIMMTADVGRPNEV